MARSVPIYDTQVTVAPGVFPLSTPHVDKSVHRGRVRPEVHGKTAPIGDLVKKVPNGTLSLESSTCPRNNVPEERGVSKPSSYTATPCTLGTTDLSRATGTPPS